MNKCPVETSQENIRELMVIHLALTLLAPVCLFLLLGCTEDPEAKKAELGPEASVDQVNKALDEAMDSRSPSQTRVGDQVLYELNQRVEASAVIKMRDILTEVKSRQEDENFTIYLLDETTVDYEPKEPETVRREIEWRVAKPKLPELPPASLSPLNLFSPLQDLLAKAPPVTFHNLEIKRSVRPPPAAVENSSDCRGLSPCELNVTEVNFDLVEWPSPDDWKTTAYRYIYSSDTPYPGHLVLLCVKTLIDTEERDYFVSQCQVLRDFIAGPPPSEE